MCVQIALNATALPAVGCATISFSPLGPVAATAPPTGTLLSATSAVPVLPESALDADADGVGVGDDTVSELWPPELEPHALSVTAPSATAPTVAVPLASTVRRDGRWLLSTESSGFGRVTGSRTVGPAGSKNTDRVRATTSAR